MKIKTIFLFCLSLSFNVFSLSYIFPKKINKTQFIIKNNNNNQITQTEKIKNKKNNFMTLIRSENIFPTLLLSFSGGWIVNPSIYNLLKNKSFIVSNIVTILIMCSSMIINDIVDINIDKINNPNKLLVNGSVKISEAFIYLFSLLFTTELLSIIYLPKKMQYITNLSILNILLYTPVFKKILFLKNISCAFLVSFSVIFSSLASNNNLNNNILLKTLFISLFYGSFHNELLLDINDKEGDKINGIYTVPVIFGNKKLVNFLLIINILVMIFNSYLLKKYYTLKVAFLLSIIFSKLFLDLINIKKNNYEKNIIRNSVKNSNISLFLLLLYYCYIAIL